MDLSEKIDKIVDRLQWINIVLIKVFIFRFLLHTILSSKLTPILIKKHSNPV